MTRGPTAISCFKAYSKRLAPRQCLQHSRLEHASTPRCAAQTSESSLASLQRYAPHCVTFLNWQKAGDENLLYNRKLQGTPGKSLTTAAVGPTDSAAGDGSAHRIVKTSELGESTRPDSCSPLGQSAVKLPMLEASAAGAGGFDHLHTGSSSGWEGHSTTVIDWGAHRAFWARGKP